jgi:hypothetical protein
MTAAVVPINLTSPILESFREVTVPPSPCCSPRSGSLCAGEIAERYVAGNSDEPTGT